MRTLYPYPTLVGEVVMHAPKVWVTTPEHGERPLPSAYIDPDRSDVLLTAMGNEEWEQARLGLSVSIPVEEVKAAAEWSEARVLVEVECRYTNLRIAVELDKQDGRGSRWTGEVTIPRSVCYGRGTIGAALIVTTAGEDDRPIGFSNSWTLDFDELPPNPIHGSIPILWVSFKEPNSEALSYLRQYTKDPWMLSLEPLSPTLYLNVDFPRLAALLEAPRLSGVDAAMRDILRGGLASQVWQAMFMYSLASAELNEDTGEVQPPPEEWQRQVLALMLGRMYPGRPEDDALREARTSMTTGAAVAVLEQLLIPASTEQAQAPRLLLDSLKKLELEAAQAADEEV